ncbi:hypothetical protein Tco_0427674 [Tanacetum coccineum]
MVGDKRVWRNDTWDWRWDWARELRGRGLGDFEELTVLTNFFFPNVLQEDSWRWIHDDDGAFTVKKLREMVDGKILIRTIGAQETKWSFGYGYSLVHLFALAVCLCKQQCVSDYDACVFH